jgi:hypothetical protein
VINSSQKPIPDNRKHSQETDIRAPDVFEHTFSAGEGQQAYTLDSEVTGTFLKLITVLKNSRRLPYPLRDAASFYHHITFIRNPLKHL